MKRKIVHLADRATPPPDRAAVRLEAVHLQKFYRRRPAVRDVSFSIAQGEVVGLFGRNGAGKTTIFYMITGQYRPDAGSIMLGGQDITKLPVYRRARAGVGYLPQETSIFRGLTVEKNLRAVIELNIRDRDKQNARLEALLTEFSISHLRHSSAAVLSGGECRRVEIARALAADPAFLLLDEPFAGIDPMGQGEIRSLIAHLRDRGIGILITEHNLHETLDIVDRAIIIHDGAILHQGPPGEIVDHPGVRRVYLGDRFNWSAGRDHSHRS